MTLRSLARLPSLRQLHLLVDGHLRLSAGDLRPSDFAHLLPFDFARAWP